MVGELSVHDVLSAQLALGLGEALLMMCGESAPHLFDKHTPLRGIVGGNLAPALLRR